MARIIDVLPERGRALVVVRAVEHKCPFIELSSGVDDGLAVVIGAEFSGDPEVNITRTRGQGDHSADRYQVKGSCGCSICSCAQELMVSATIVIQTPPGYAVSWRRNTQPNSC